MVARSSLRLAPTLFSFFVRHLATFTHSTSSESLVSHQEDHISVSGGFRWGFSLLVVSRLPKFLAPLVDRCLFGVAFSKGLRGNLHKKVRDLVRDGRTDDQLSEDFSFRWGGLFF